MKKTLLAVMLVVMSLPGAGLSAPPGRSVKDLPQNYRKWLEEEVVYIITPKEKEVFLKLENDRERELFIEAFWKQRDPNPNTPENEFKKEHFRRIAYANQWYGRDTPGPGWRSAMGRIYIMLGEPNQIEKFENLTEVFPIHIWFYEGKLEYGLPNAFNVVFFKPEGDAEWKLYTPIKYGPQALLIQYAGDQTDYIEAYRQLMGIEPSIASVSLSLIPGETSLAMPSPSIASEILIQSKIPSAPREKVKDAYAENFYKYKDTVGVEYTANYIDNDFSASVIRDAIGHVLRPLPHRAPEALARREREPVLYDPAGQRPRVRLEGLARLPGREVRPHRARRGPDRQDQGPAVQLPGPLPARGGNVPGERPRQEPGLEGVHFGGDAGHRARSLRDRASSPSSWPTGSSRTPPTRG